MQTAKVRARSAAEPLPEHARTSAAVWPRRLRAASCLALFKATASVCVGARGGEGGAESPFFGAAQQIDPHWNICMVFAPPPAPGDPEPGPPRRPWA